MTTDGDDRIGHVLSGTWRLQAQLGTGSVATVYRAVHVRNGLHVAIKVLHRHLCDDETIRGRFLREGYLGNRVGHPAVVRVLDDGAEGDDVYLVMELLAGRSLQDHWTSVGRRMPREEVEPIVAGVLDVLVAAHAAGVVHRDIKPDNVFLEEGGGIRVLDFGIARLREEQAFAHVATVNGTTLGTPAFMPPEQALGRWDEVDGRSDLYAVGATAFTLLTGQFVHHATSLPDLLLATATASARRIRDVDPHVPPSVAAWIDRALAFAPSDRWPDARAMLDAVRAPEPAERTQRLVPDRSLAKTRRIEPELLEPESPTVPLQPWAETEELVATRLMDLQGSAPRPPPVAPGPRPPPAAPRTLLFGVPAALVVAGMATGLLAAALLLWLVVRG